MWDLSGWRGCPFWCWGLIWKRTEKLWLGFSALDFGRQFLCSEAPNGHCVPYYMQWNIWGKMELNYYLRFSWEKGEFLSALPIPDHAMPPLDCRNGLFLQQHWSKQQQQQLSVGNCSVAFGQGGSSAKPGPADGSQPQPGVGGTGRGPRPCHAWKRGSLELNLAVLHFPREQDEERQFLCWPSCMINGEFKHSIGLLCNLAVLLMFSGKVCFSPMKCGAEFSQQHHLKWLEASVLEFSR